LQGVHYPPSPNALLPSDRVNECRPFSVIGLDYTGYFKVKENNATSKVYIALFSCAVSRAVHLELVNDNSVETFLQAFRRFAARRGLPNRIYTDNGSYFVCASEYIRKMQSLPSVKDYLEEHHVQWKFNPARASFFGGHFERLIGVVKSCLKKLLGKSFVTREEFATILVEAEGIVNSRPLTYVSDQFTDDNPLTPQDLLTGHKLVQLPVPTEYLEKDEDFQVVNVKHRYKKVLNKIEHFWKIWKNDYLLHLKQRNTVSGHLQIQKGDVVLIENDSSSRLRWKLGLVTKLNTAKDGFTRSVTVKTDHGEITRAVIHLYPLEINCNLEPQTSNVEDEPHLPRTTRKAHVLARQRIKDIYANE
jgi:transposase InsO family protein